MQRTAVTEERAKAGDAAAFSELYARYYRELYRYAYYVLGSAEDAEDVVMDTVADAYANIASLRDASLFKNWIFKILYNKAKRKRGAIYIGRPAELREETAASGGGEDGRIENADLAAALAKLGEEERNIVVLSVVAGYHSKEIAAVMKINASTVRSRQRRALLKLRQILGGGKEVPYEA